MLSLVDFNKNFNFALAYLVNQEVQISKCLGGGPDASGW